MKFKLLTVFIAFLVVYSISFTFVYFTVVNDYRNYQNKYDTFSNQIQTYRNLQAIPYPTHNNPQILFIHAAQERIIIIDFILSFEEKREFVKRNPTRYDVCSKVFPGDPLWPDNVDNQLTQEQNKSYALGMQKFQLGIVACYANDGVQLEDSFTQSRKYLSNFLKTFQIYAG